MRAAPLLVPLLVGVGCQDYYFTQKAPDGYTEAVISQGGATPVPADILFIVDNSCSMADEQENLARNFDAFIREIAGTGDYRIGIITTDVDYPNGEQGGFTSTSFSPAPPYYQSQPTSRAGCMSLPIGHSCFRGPDPSLRILNSAMSRDVQIQTFAQNVMVGSCGSGNETGLEAMTRALDRTGGRGCNSNFMRSNANLVLIFVSDEDDHGGSLMAGYLARLALHKDLSSVRVAAIVGADDDGNASNCRVGSTQCGSQCSGPRPPAGTPAANDWDRGCHWCSLFNAPDCCSAEAGNRYVRFARLLEERIADDNPSIDRTGCKSVEGKRVACLVDSICQNEFADTLSKIARDLVSISEYALDPPACNPEGVTVKVNGENLPREAIVINEAGTRLAIRGEHAPGPEDHVEIYFVIDGCK